MSVALSPWDLSNPVSKPWVVAVVVLVLILYPAPAQVVGVYADVMAVIAALGSTAAMYRNPRDCT
ncbi:hypothetical protein [Streptomyces sp. NPDC127112]|uniref:hypothetical protein n=1 Tax=Streptomyces sp. NPDC127112 TaxID=3345364 RepID=UPI003639D9A8